MARPAEKLGAILAQRRSDQYGHSKGATVAFFPTTAETKSWRLHLAKTFKNVKQAGSHGSTPEMAEMTVSDVNGSMPSTVKMDLIRRFTVAQDLDVCTSTGTMLEGIDVPNINTVAMIGWDNLVAVHQGSGRAGREAGLHDPLCLVLHRPEMAPAWHRLALEAVERASMESKMAVMVEQSLDQVDASAAAMTVRSEARAASSLLAAQEDALEDVRPRHRWLCDTLNCRWRGIALHYADNPGSPADPPKCTDDNRCDNCAGKAPFSCVGLDEDVALAVVLGWAEAGFHESVPVPRSWDRVARALGPRLKDAASDHFEQSGIGEWALDSLTSQRVISPTLHAEWRTETAKTGGKAAKKQKARDQEQGEQGPTPSFTDVHVIRTSPTTSCHLKKKDCWVNYELNFNAFFREDKVEAAKSARMVANVLRPLLRTSFDVSVNVPKFGHK